MLYQEEILLLVEGLNTLPQTETEPFPLQSFSTAL